MVLVFISFLIVFFRQTIDALEANEQLTQLGLHLLDLPIEPNLGINGFVFSCTQVRGPGAHNRVLAILS